MFIQFYAKIFTMNLTSILTHRVQDDVTKEDSKKKHPYQINFTKALSCMKDTIVLLFIRPYRIKLVQQLFALFKKIIDEVEKLTRTSYTPSYLEIFFCNFKAQSRQSSPSSIKEEVVISVDTEVTSGSLH